MGGGNPNLRISVSRSGDKYRVVESKTVMCSGEEGKRWLTKGHRELLGVGGEFTILILMVSVRTHLIVHLQCVMY